MEKICNICFEDVTNEKHILTLCNHLFCIGCLAQWFVIQVKSKAQQTCPVCRKKHTIDLLQWTSFLPKDIHLKPLKRNLIYRA